MMRTFILAAAAALTAVASPAAAVVVTSTPGSTDVFKMPENADVKIDFNTDALPEGFTYQSSNAQYMTTSNADGAMPAFSDGSRYFSVLGGGSASILTTGQGYDMISMFLGSIDTYNTIELLSTTGAVIQRFTGSDFSPPMPANGNQTHEMTNRRITFNREAGDAAFGGFRISSGTNSAEIDNVAMAVPEPATWAMMLVGFAMVGAVSRARKARTTSVYA